MWELDVNYSTTPMSISIMPLYRVIINSDINVRYAVVNLGFVHTENIQLIFK